MEDNVFPSFFNLFINQHRTALSAGSYLVVAIILGFIATAKILKEQLNYFHHNFVFLHAPHDGYVISLPA
jgi:hypothetical protein